MTLLPHLAARLFGVPLAIHRPKLDVILAVLGPRVAFPTSGVDLPVLTGHTPPARAAPDLASPSPAHHRPGVAVIPIHGTLVRRTVGLEAESGLTSYAGLAAQLDAALVSPDVAAILLDIDSPGGESGGVFDLADRIRAASRIKPVWAVANDMAFSAAYALASAATQVFVSRTGGVGSIGVIAMHVDQSQKDAQDGVRYTAVFAGECKNDLNPHEPMSSEGQARLQAEVDRIHGLFVETVARHRGLAPAAVRGTEAGLFFGQAAVAIGLADAVGSLDDALAQLVQSLAAVPTAIVSSFPVSRPTSVAHRHPVGPVSHHSPSNPSMESRMTPPNHSDAPVEPAADADAQTFAPVPHVPPVSSVSHASPVPRTATTQPLSASDAIEVAQTCTLAGRTDLITGFLEAQASPAQVRHQLLAAQAEASPEIVSRIDPNAALASTQAAHPNAAHNPLIQAIQSRLATR